MGDHSPDIFDTEDDEASNNENIVEESEQEPEEEQDEGEEGSGSFEEEEEDDEHYDPWDPLRVKVGSDLKEPYMKEVKRFLDIGKTQEYAENAELLLMRYYL